METADIQLSWTENLGESLGNGRYAFYAELTPKPDDVWKKCFQDVVSAFNKTGPFDAAVQSKPAVCHAVVFGRLRDFENTLSVELEAAVSQTNSVCKRVRAQQELQTKEAAAQRDEEPRIIEDLKRKFVKK